MTSPSSVDSMLLERGKSAVRQVIDEPVKEAVREAHAEEMARHERSTHETTRGGSQTFDAQERTGAPGGSSGGRRITVPRLLLTLGGAVAFAYLRRRRRSNRTQR